MTNAVQMSSSENIEDPTVNTPAAEEAVATEPGITFAEIGLPEQLVAALARNSITVPSPIQAQSIPDALAGTNVLGRAQTGSGKTLAFGLPMLTRLSRHEDRPAAKRPRALVLVPTRELAFQVVDSLNSYAGALGLTVRPAVGGTPFAKQVDQLRRGVDVLVATPGRLGDHLRQGTCILDSVEITALDEADQMADMGFLPEVRSILGETPADGQRLLFSATLDREVQSLVRQFLANHVTHSTEDGRASVDTMEHYVLLVDRGQKDSVLAEIGARDGRTIMFARTKLGCEGITDRSAQSASLPSRFTAARHRTSAPASSSVSRTAAPRSSSQRTLQRAESTSTASTSSFTSIPRLTTRTTCTALVVPLAPARRHRCRHRAAQPEASVQASDRYGRRQCRSRCRHPGFC